MPMPEIVQHAFTSKIISILEKHFGEYAFDIFTGSSLLGYLNKKTKSVNRGSKARAAFANHYALYVIIEDYIHKGFADGSADIDYSKYEGARFSDLFQRQRSLPFGSRLQNHAFNSRLNEEFKKLYPSTGKLPIVRDITTQRYWIQEDLLHISVRHKDGKDVVYNIAFAIIDIINAYIDAKRAAFESFIQTCRQIAQLGEQDPDTAIDFVIQQLEPSVDARVFEIVSYAVLKAKFGKESIWIGDARENVAEKYLILYKTGRTNANDGGIDFVMKPLGRFFQVTETIDINKYFLDIDKVQRFPISFVVKSNNTAEQIRETIRIQAQQKYKIDTIVKSYMDAIEDIINTKDLITAFNDLVKTGDLQGVMDEIILQSKLEFNYGEDGDINQNIE